MKIHTCGRTGTLAVALSLGLCLPMSGAAAAPTTSADRSATIGVTTTALPGLPGASGPTNAYAINKAGTVVGSATTAAGAMHAVVWRGTAITDLGRSGETSSAAFGVNDLGHIVGMTGNRFDNRAVLWQGGRRYVLPAPPDPSPSDYIYGCAATSINNAGLIGGFCDVDINSSVVGLPVIWRDRSPHVPWSRGQVFSVNDSGHLAGWYEHGYNGEGLRAVLKVGSRTRELPTLIPGSAGNGDQAFSLNRNDLVVGQSAGRPVRWRDGQVQALPAPSGVGAARAVNAWGTVVGVEGLPARPVMWKSGVLIPLGTVGGAAASVNDRGFVAGWIVRDDGTTGAVRWRVTGSPS